MLDAETIAKAIRNARPIPPRGGWVRCAEADAANSALDAAAYNLAERLGRQNLGFNMEAFWEACRL